MTEAPKNEVHDREADANSARQRTTTLRMMHRHETEKKGRRPSAFHHDDRLYIVNGRPGGE